MEDHEIRDVMNRRKWPVVTPVFSLRQSGSQTRVLDVTIENRGSVRVMDFALKVIVPALKLEPKVQHFDHVLQSSFKSNYQELVFRSSKVRMPPIFPEDSLTITQQGAHLSFVIKSDSEQFRDEKLYWVVYADDAPPRSGKRS